MLVKLKSPTLRQKLAMQRCKERLLQLSVNDCCVPTISSSSSSVTEPSISYGRVNVSVKVIVLASLFIGAAEGCFCFQGRIQTESYYGAPAPFLICGYEHPTAV